MVRTYCKIIGTREQDYSGNTNRQGINQEMTVFSGGAGVPYTEDVIRAARDVFQLYGGRTAYSSGVFSSVMRTIAGQTFVCYGISQKQALGRESQFTQVFVVPREDLLDGDAYLQEVFGRNFVSEEMIHRSSQPMPEEIFTVSAYSRREVNRLSEQRLKVLMHAVVLLCNGKKVLLVERDKEYQKDFFRPLLRELFELIPAGHRYQINFTTGRCLDDIDRLDSAQLIVTNQAFTGTEERPQLCLDEREESRKPNTRVWPGITLSKDGRNESVPSADDPSIMPQTYHWAMEQMAIRDELADYSKGMGKTLQTEFAELMDCMDEKKSYWWRFPKQNKSIRNFNELRARHESTPLLVRSERSNAEFCKRLPELLDLEDGVEELYFDFGRMIMPEDVRRKNLGYITVRLRKFGLSDEAFSRLQLGYADYEKSMQELQSLRKMVAQSRAKEPAEAEFQLTRMRQAGEALLQIMKNTWEPAPDARRRQTGTEQA
ncbi:MAG: hypothetical protein LLF75_00270 [Eubacteriales bacterium]|nr:hypothetical protein [Eubacteriales bacterium]